MDRRSFLLAGAAGATVAASGAGYWRWQELTPRIDPVGRALGHFLRERNTLPPPAYEWTTDVAILGSGIAGLTAAWKLAREGQRKVLMMDGPELHGNAAGGAFGALRFPTGAHYLPLPSVESIHVREILHDLDILQGDPHAERPHYDERFILHAPEERVLFNGRWQEGILPRDDVPAAELQQHARFNALLEQFKHLRGNDGRRVFVMPSALSSSDPRWLGLDQISFRQWLLEHELHAPTLHWYADYCTRDDYGAGYDAVSAWAGLHYFCSRGGEAANASPGAWLTWPDGLASVAAGLDRATGVAHHAGAAASVTLDGDQVRILCVELVDGK
ncbi:MAG: FAD-dependent oxidoreductase, partial [Pseudomonadota bacterium]|nr:FAD-dependent oxidoreductase [Pseudomonadota bacterium]